MFCVGTGSIFHKEKEEPAEHSEPGAGGRIGVSSFPDPCVHAVGLLCQQVAPPQHLL